MQDSAEVNSPLPFVLGSPVIAINPHDVVTLVNNGVEHTQEGDMTLLNKLPHSRVCYKIKTTAPKDYIVRPSSGIIEAGGSEKIYLSCTKRDMAKSDRFMIQSFSEPKGVEYTTPLPRDLWQHNRKCYHDQRILVELSKPVSSNKGSEELEETAMNHDFLPIAEMSPVASEAVTVKSTGPVVPSDTAEDEAATDEVDEKPISTSAPVTPAVPSTSTATSGVIHHTTAANKASATHPSTLPMTSGSSTAAAATSVPVVSQRVPSHPRSTVTEDEILFTPLQVIFLIVGCIALLKILRIL